MKSISLGLALAAFAVGIGCASTAAAATNLVTNGDFTTPNTGASWGEFLPAVTGWSDANEPGGEVEIGNSAVYGLPCDTNTGSCQNLEVNANTFGDVSQTVGHLGGGRYVIGFDYGGRTSGGPQAMEFLVNGVQVLPTISDSIGAWMHYSYDFTAPSGGSADIEFLSLNEGGQPSYGNEITNVSMVAVPEPATWAMMLLGIGLVGAGLRMARRKDDVSFTTI